MILVTHVGRAEGSRALAAALACAGADPDRAALLIELTDARAPRPTLVASTSARMIEERLVAHLPEACVASRGRLCHLALPVGEDGMEALGAALAVARGLPCVLHVPPPLLQRALGEPGAVSAVALRADLSETRALTALVARDLIGRGLRVAVLKRPLGWVPARLASIGALPPGSGAALPQRLVSRMVGDGSSPLPDSCDSGPDGTADTARAPRQER